MKQIEKQYRILESRSSINYSDGGSRPEPQCTQSWIGQFLSHTPDTNANGGGSPRRGILQAACGKNADERSGLSIPESLRGSRVQKRGKYNNNNKHSNNYVVIIPAHNHSAMHDGRSWSMHVCSLSSGMMYGTSATRIIPLALRASCLHYIGRKDHSNSRNNNVEKKREGKEKKPCGEYHEASGICGGS